MLWFSIGAKTATQNVNLFKQRARWLQGSVALSLSHYSMGLKFYWRAQHAQEFTTFSLKPIFWCFFLPLETSSDTEEPKSRTTIALDMLSNRPTLATNASCKTLEKV